jgi:hypothetical protein
MLYVKRMHPSSLGGRSNFFKEYKNIFLMWCAPKLLKRPKGGSQNETTGKEESWGMLPKSQHFGVRKACWGFGMGLGQTHKWEFKMRSNCTITKRGQLVQVEWKWCIELKRDNLKHKLYMVCNLWDEAPLPSL